ncbi:DUF4197 domain-containing protein [Campylobacter blaseri]|uniref:DUF4197 domain-containing protein n=1 Tax=Campylobacter blaseri TaxID=2042961 RepID=A0A2P8R3P8_9BACT|nr:DUF4197 domain-containing protein [Campylobacter blaseri]PSM53131.1 hypothetical protein CQ405_00850 [Campylobacter blaseri]PSM54597.1 hypothetical protein CRN67_00850 [Campylobacter blaseri]QKF86930.1 DUF4197 domain-containing protein [Campylobacter blaseri]
MKKIFISFAVLVAVYLSAFDFSNVLNTTKDVVNGANSNDNYKSMVEKALNLSVQELSKNGFINNQVAKIPLPAHLQTAANLAKKVGGEKWANDLTISINQSATKAVGGASKVFYDVIKNMKEDEIKTLFTSKDNGFTKYLQKNSSDKLSAVFKPIIEDMMSENKFATAYNGLNSFAKNSSLLNGKTASNLKNLAGNFGGDKYIPNTDEDLNDYITRKTLDGLFALMGEKESGLKSRAVGKGLDLLNKF